MQFSNPIVLLCAGFMVSVPTFAAAKIQGDPFTLAPMLEQVTPHVVNIATSTTVQVSNSLSSHPFFRQFYNIPRSAPRYRKVESAGSGVILDAAQGIVITNFHVVGYPDEIVVGLADGTDLVATYVGGDAPTDVAVLRVDPANLPPLAPLSVARETPLRVGDFVVAIGNPFGIGQTVTGGMVSALGRSGLGISSHEDLIQTDASINPGNSGGALVDLNGTLVGINTAVLRASGGGNLGIGFAIPTSVMLAASLQLQTYGEVRNGHFGAQIEGLKAVFKAANGMTPEQRGVVVTSVEPDSPAGRAGIQPGMVITHMNGNPTQSTADFYGLIVTVMVGDQVSVTTLNRAGQRRQVVVKIPDDAYAKVLGYKLSRALAGALFQNNRAGEHSEIPAGVRVLSVEANSRFARLGLQPGDLLVAEGNRKIRHLSDLTAYVNQSNSVSIEVHRNGRYLGHLRVK